MNVSLKKKMILGNRLYTSIVLFLWRLYKYCLCSIFNKPVRNNSLTRAIYNAKYLFTLY